MSQPYIKLNNGLKIPQVGLGVYLASANTCSSIVTEALQIGYRHVDTAVFYRNEHEAASGILTFVNSKAAAAGAADKPITRKDCFFTTKIWESDHGYNACKKAIADEFAKVKELGYIDLLLIHSPNVYEGTLAERRETRLGTWKAMQEAVDEGIVKSIGVSNYGVHHIEELLAWKDLKIVPAVNQVELHPWLQRKELVDFCRSKGIELEAYSPLTRGQKLRDPVDPQLVEYGKKYNKSPAQILIRWSIQMGFITLPKSVHKERLIENFDVFDFELSKQDMESLGDKDAYGITGWDPTTSD